MESVKRKINDLRQSLDEKCDQVEDLKRELAEAKDISQNVRVCIVLGSLHLLTNESRIYKLGGQTVPHEFVDAAWADMSGPRPGETGLLALTKYKIRTMEI